MGFSQTENIWLKPLIMALFFIQLKLDAIYSTLCIKNFAALRLCEIKKTKKLCVFEPLWQKTHTQNFTQKTLKIKLQTELYSLIL
ncbi:hypothetical protein [Flavobacterium sp. UBA7680]|uniref:hypothetical protein n=1 Tax=Flavobacterium sp. UBA7680 TaxID=1946559 RepID=UPI0025C0D449|nr:hypothetical protein [Flavobacterium sp. UBA7680]